MLQSSLYFLPDSHRQVGTYLPFFSGQLAPLQYHHSFLVFRHSSTCMYRQISVYRLQEFQDSLGTSCMSLILILLFLDVDVVHIHHSHSFLYRPSMTSILKTHYLSLILMSFNFTFCALGTFYKQIKLVQKRLVNRLCIPSIQSVSQYNYIRVHLARHQLWLVYIPIQYINHNYKTIRSQ